MKTYEEMTQSVMDKVQTRRAAQRRRNNTLMLTAASFCLIMVSALMVGKLTDVDHSGVVVTNPTVVTTNTPVINVQVDKPRFTLLCASRDGSTAQVLEEKIKVPYRAEVCVWKVAGMSKEERQKIINEKNAYVNQVIGSDKPDNSCGWYSLDNVLVTTICEGQFGIKLNDIDAVTRVRVGVTEQGMLMSWPRAEASRTSAYTFSEDQTLMIDIDGDALKQRLEQSNLDTLNLIWNLSPWAVVKIDKDPDMDLSQFSDKITIWINYKDGREEVSTISIQLDSVGNVYAMLEETVINA